MYSSLFLLTLFTGPLDERGISGECVDVFDGNTIVVELESGKRETVRFYGVLAPHRNQEYGAESRLELAKMCYGKWVNVVFKAIENNGRIVGIVLCDGIDLGAEQIALGNAWHDHRPHHSKLMATYQSSAKKLGRGLWASENPIAPWKWQRP